jgi:tubulin polyglutamylase TTLL5
MLQEDNLQPQTNTSGFSFVTVAPKTCNSDNPAAKRIKMIQEVEKESWKGIHSCDIGKIGRPINPGPPESPYLRLFEARCKAVLDKISKGNDYRPPLLLFQAVKENQLVREAPPQNVYCKGNLYQQYDLLYRVYKTDARLVRSVLELVGFRHTDSHDWNIMWICSSAKNYQYEGLNEYQKVNHFPRSNEITRKDRMCESIMNMKDRFGHDEFDFIPQTYVLPDEFPDFYAHFQTEKHSMWIVKPSCSSQGRGIFLVDNINEVPMEEDCIISKYIYNPLLINGLKFDLRLYVLVTCFDPLKIYIYNEGLARFASEEYSPGNKNNKFMHLTNYSINKKSENFIQNTDIRKDDVGHKWSLSALCRHLESVGVDTDLLWSRIYDLVIKSILSIEPTVREASKKLALHRNNCFDLFGFDVILDSNLKPWLLEVNLSPSLATDSPLDLHIKGNLIADTFNLLGVRAFDRKKEAMSKVKTRLRARQNLQTQIKRMTAPPGVRARHSEINMQRLEDYMHTKEFREILKETLEEYQRRNNFVRIYPAKGTDIYDRFFNSVRLTNKALYQVLYLNLMNKQEILDNPQPVAKHQSSASTCEPSPKRADLNNRTEGSSRSIQFKTKTNSSFDTEKSSRFDKQSIDNTTDASDSQETSRKCANCRIQLKDKFSLLCVSCKPGGSKEEKLIITGDDILIEYIARLMHAIKALSSSSIKPQWRKNVEKFLSHYIWEDQEARSESDICSRLEHILVDMKERRKKLLISKGKIDVEKAEEQKYNVIRGFSAAQLEEMLRKTTKNIARELVECLIEPESGILTEIIKWLASSAARRRKESLFDRPARTAGSTLANDKQFEEDKFLDLAAVSSSISQHRLHKSPEHSSVSHKVIYSSWQKTRSFSTKRR